MKTDIFFNIKTITEYVEWKGGHCKSFQNALLSMAFTLAMVLSHLLGDLREKVSR